VTRAPAHDADQPGGATETRPRILLAYATAGSEGQTVLIVEHLARALRLQGAAVVVADLEDVHGRAAIAPGYDGVIAGGSVRGGRYRRSLRRFLDRNRTTLAGLPWAFFSVCLTVAATSETARRGAAELPRKLLRRHGLEAGEVAVFAGALRFSRHTRLGARLLFATNRRYLGRTSMDEDWEYTDWDQVDAFGGRFLASLSADAGPRG
jgi:menaquinone-dependent protoporphyrinogen oxidase